MEQPASRRVLIFGAGSIGSEVATTLYDRGFEVHVAAWPPQHLELLESRVNDIEPRYNASFHLHVCDVLDITSLLKLEKEIFPEGGFQDISGFVYAVGSCPPGGFADEVSVPLHQLSARKWEESIDLYVTGFLNCCRHFLPYLSEQGHIVSLSSSITRLTPDTCPPWLNAWHYVASKAALDKIVLGFRHDPLVREKNIKVHRIAPAAVDTSFHTESLDVPEPAQLVPLECVAMEVANALVSSHHIDKELTPNMCSQPENFSAIFGNPSPRLCN